VQAILDAIVRFIPPPKDDAETGKVKALIFDSVYNMYRGVIVYLRVFSGKLCAGDEIYLMESGTSFEILELGMFRPAPKPTRHLPSGMVGYLIANIRNPEEVKIGETITLKSDPAREPVIGFTESKPMVFSGVYPVDPTDYENLKTALEKLRLNDSSLNFEAETSVALGFGFRAGFLGLLHMEIIQERIDREYDVGIIMTSPSVIYKIMDLKGEIHEIDNPTRFPSPETIAAMDEPFIRAYLIVPSHCIGVLMRLCGEKRGELLTTETLSMDQVMLTYRLPLAEILTDFYDKLKSITQGYGSMEYEFEGYRPTDLVKLEILLNGEPVDAFSTLIHRSKAQATGRALIAKLKTVIPRHLFSIPIQAAIGNKIIARETVKALRKNVTAKCYGGDVTRKRKLLEKQKEGKKRMKQIGKVQVPKTAFLEVLKSE
jgi:GTP-binding protein LepA